MKRESINRLYFMWICGRLFGEDETYSEYYDILSFLHDTDFTYSIPMDSNREEDGFDLRYRFAYEEEIDKRIVASELDHRPCSVLEMMAALALRCEEQIMTDDSRGDRTGTWFFVMLYSLGLDAMDNDHFDAKKAGAVMKRFLERRYRRDGRGGLFYVKGCKKDLRSIEIWYQMNLYMSCLIEREDN